MRYPTLTFMIMILFIDSYVVDTIYQSYIKFSVLGMQYLPRNSMDLIQTISVSRSFSCSAACNLQILCRTFDFDSTLGQCRLFEGDLTTGSIVPSASPTSIVGSVQSNTKLFASVHNQPCQACQYNRYEVCSNSTYLCRCPPRSYWNGIVCLPQLYLNQTCSQQDSCRADLNLTCSMNCYGEFRTCISGRYRSN